MKLLEIEYARLERSIRAAGRDKIVLTRRGKPVAVVICTAGMDLEQIELGCSPAFWKLIRKRRAEKTITHEELLRRLAEMDKKASKPQTRNHKPE